MAELQDVTEANFVSEILESGMPALVDFWGDHCAACRQISPILSGLAQEYEGRVRVVKIHAAENPQIAAQFGVRAMPTVLAFSDGQVVGQLVGARPKKDFVSLIDRALT